MNDEDDIYPNEAELERIKNWDGINFKELMNYVGALWYQPDWGWHEDSTENGIRYSISTAGWSGNEDLIGALSNNLFFWNMCWIQSKRGGHYIFEVRNANFKT